MSFILFLMCSTAAITGPLFFWLGRQSRDARCRKAIDAQSAMHHRRVIEIAERAYRDGLVKRDLARSVRDITEAMHRN